MLITLLLALAATAQATPPVPLAIAQPPRASVHAVARARIISAAQVRIGSTPVRGQTNVRDGIINFE